MNKLEAKFPNASKAVAVQLSVDEIADLKLLRQHLLRRQPQPWWPSDVARDMERFLRLVDKFLDSMT